MKIADNPRYQLVMKWMAATMSLAYMALGLALLLGAGQLQEVPWTQRLLLGGIMLSYGLFRGYRFVANHYWNRQKDNHEE